MSKNEEIVRAIFAAFESGNRDDLAELQAADFHFSAPPDPSLDKAGFFERCWPFHKSHPHFTFEEILVREDTVIVLYFCTRSDGPPIRNIEMFKLRDGKVASVTVFFGPAVGS